MKSFNKKPVNIGSNFIVEKQWSLFRKYNKRRNKVFKKINFILFLFSLKIELSIEKNRVILFIIIVFKRGLSGTIRARGLKFWLQVALSAPIATAWTEIRKSGSGSGKSGFCPEIFFRFFRFYGPLGTSGSLPGGSRTT